MTLRLSDPYCVSIGRCPFMCLLCVVFCSSCFSVHYIFFFFFLRIRRPPSSPLFPSPTLFRSPCSGGGGARGHRWGGSRRRATTALLWRLRCWERSRGRTCGSLNELRSPSATRGSFPTCGASGRGRCEPAGDRHRWPRRLRQVVHRAGGGAAAGLGASRLGRAIP